MTAFPFLVLFVSYITTQATHIGTNDDNLPNQELAEMKTMMKSQSDLIQSQGELLRKYGQRIEILEKENLVFAQKLETLQADKDLAETRMKDRDYIDLVGQLNPNISDPEPRQTTKKQSHLHPRRSIQRKVGHKVSRIQRVPEIVNSTVVGFYSQLVTRNPLQLGLYQTIEFEHVITNVGNGYDPKDGHFTAPIPGLYSFTCTALLHSLSSHDMHLSIVKNGVNVGIVYSHIRLNEGSRTIVISLAVGDKVWIRNTDNNSPNIYAAGYTTFSGFLIPPQ